MPKTVYQCEHCGAVFTAKIDATACEQTHCYVTKILKAEYGENFDRKTKYPSSILCKMSDNKEVKFYRKESAIR